MKLSRHSESCFGIVLPVVLVILLTVCVGPANSAPEPGTVTILLNTEPEDLDPGNISRAITGQVMMQNITETLTEMNPADSSIMPRLATSWKQVDANTWNFSLRKGVKFHDGLDFNAEAVIFNIKRLYDKRRFSQIRDKYFGNVKMEGKALDSHTLELKTENPEPVMLTLMALLPICSPNTPMDKLIRNPVGTGPYKLVKWDAGTEILVESFDGYWGKHSPVKKAVYRWRTESAVRAAMVEIGEADLAVNIAYQEARRPDLDFSYFNGETTYLRFGGPWEPPLNDRRVRMAMILAVDRNAIRGSILSKDVIPAAQLVVPGIFGYNPDLKPWPYDPQKAKQLLEEARKDGVPIDKEILLVGRIGWFPGDTELMEAILTMYKAVGLNAKLKMIEAGVWRSYQNRPFPPNAGPYLVEVSHNNNSGDAWITISTIFHCKGYVGSMCDKTVDEMIDKARVSTGEARRTLWWSVFKRVHEEILPTVELFHMVSYARVGKRINYKPTFATNAEVQLAQITFKQ